VGRPDLAANPDFGTLLTTPEIRAQLWEVFSEIFATRTTAEWCERLMAEHQRFAPVRTHAEVAADPQALANGYLVEVEHPDWGRTTLVGSPVALSATPTVPGVEVAELGQHTEEVLLEHGYDWDDISRLRDLGVL
jgi:formyl-CoA transferase